MNQETIENHIKNLSKYDFDGVAGLVLHKIFNLTAVDVDDKGDGGSDFRIFNDLGGHRTISVQKTVQDNAWQEKALQDAIKSKNDIGALRFFFLTSRAHQPTSFRDLEERISSNLGIPATCMGATEIAGLLIEKKLLSDFATVIGLTTNIATQQRPDIREIMLHSYYALSNERYELREAMYDRTIQAIIHFSDTLLSREEIEEKAMYLLGCQEIRRKQLSSRMDSLFSRGHLRKAESGIELNAEIAESFNIADGIYGKELGQLAAAQQHLIEPYGGNWDQTKSEKATVLLAQMFVQRQIENANHSSLTFSKTGFGQRLGDPEQDLRAMLYESGIESTRRINEAIYGMIDLAKDKPLIKKLTRSIVYFALENAEPERASMVLGSSNWNDVKVILDASVAIPYICSSLFAPTKGRFSQGSNESMYLLKELNAKIRIPYVYLNECASHLVRAIDYCDTLKGFEDSFAYSQNCFVSHYYQLKAMGERVPDTLRGFIGVISSAAISSEPDEHKKITNVMSELQPLYSDYGIEYESINSKEISNRYLQKVQEEYLWALDEMNKKKGQNLIDHDVQVLSYLRKCHSEENARLMCLTWDGVMILVGRQVDDCGWIISPQEASDIIQPKLRLSQGSLTSLAHVVARTMERPLELAARIVDKVTLYAKEKLADWEFKQRVKEFKRDTIARIDITSPQYIDIFDQELNTFLQEQGIETSIQGSSEIIYDEDNIS